jgi:hypothetical protein
LLAVLARTGRPEALDETARPHGLRVVPVGQAAAGGWDAQLARAAAGSRTPNSPFGPAGSAWQRTLLQAETWIGVLYRDDATPRQSATWLLSVGELKRRERGWIGCPCAKATAIDRSGHWTKRCAC